MARPHEPPPSTDNHTTGRPRPWDMGCNLVGLAEELDRRDGRTPGGPPPWTTSFLMAAWRLTPTLCPSPPPGLGRSRRSESSVGRDLGRVIPALSSFPIGRLGWKCPCELGGPSKGQGKARAEGPASQMGFELQ
ncbi:uncharacterized protein [Equus przewalskii]|uniref:Uncharacterized protein isoform X2 n=1 Tax=Equus przewalskii TaxID=9798 RepID=A0ABM4MAD5_EQUPR